VTDYISTVDTCKIARARLAESWPGVIFSVRKSPSTHSDDIRVSWTDGPTTEQVEALIGSLHSGEFDGMTDLAYDNGQPYANNFMMCERHESAALLTKAAKQVCDKYGLTMPEVKTYPSGHAELVISPELDRAAYEAAHIYFNQLVWRIVQKTQGPMVQVKPSRRPAHSITTKIDSKGRKILSHPDYPDSVYIYNPTQADARLAKLTEAGINARIICRPGSGHCVIEVL
jgi:hypothetical protein